jgi:putative ATPase
MIIINLFDSQNSLKDKPLAFKMRPHSLDELTGQEDILGKGKVLRRAIENDQIQSLILCGPPGSGKTSLAHIIAYQTRAEFFCVNAVTSGIKELREIIEKSRNNVYLYDKRNILFIDEIHRFNKSQQDALLPAVEEGIIILIGATTENPYFEVISPLLSRSNIIKFNALKEEDILHILEKALKDEQRGLGKHKIKISKKTLNFITEISAGDARRALNILEISFLNTPPDKDGFIYINEELIADILQNKAIIYDKMGENHYDTISAFIKSIRGSDPDAALFWLARMIEAGEDPRFIVRRLIVHAAEDVGLADPMALVIANEAARAIDYVGMPEARIPLAEAVIYIAAAPKSNSVLKGIDSALKFVKNNNFKPVPLHLRDIHYKGAKESSYGLKYKYPHDFNNHYVEQDYFPEGMNKVEFYKPGDKGKEATIKEMLNKLKNK